VWPTSSASGQQQPAWTLRCPCSGMASATVPAIPEPLLAEIFGHACAQASGRDRGKLARVCRTSRDVVTACWAEHTEKEWGPLDWAGYFEHFHKQPLAEASSSQWGGLLATLEAQVRPRIDWKQGELQDDVPPGRRSIKQVRSHASYHAQHAAALY
jgi:hypothetical protein